MPGVTSQLRRLFGRAKDAEHALDVAERLAAGRLDGAERLAGQLGLLVDDPLSGAGVKDDHVERVTHAVVELAAMRARSSTTAS